MYSIEKGKDDSSRAGRYEKRTCGQWRMWVERKEVDGIGRAAHLTVLWEIPNLTANSEAFVVGICAGTSQTYIRIARSMLSFEAILVRRDCQGTCP